MSYYFATLQGLRPQNEDSHKIIINLDGKDKLINNVNLYSVFDGHGGRFVSTFLKNNLIDYLINPTIKYPLSKKYIYTIYDQVQNRLRSDKRAQHCGSTGLVAIHYNQLGENYLNIINSGDSRCVLCRDNFAIQLTKDHKPNWPEEYHRITQAGGNIVFDGFDWRIRDLSVSRAFGDVDATPFVTHRPDIFRYKLSPSDKFIVLGCDGLYDSVDNNEIVNFVLSNCYDSSTLVRINRNINIGRKLADYAITKGSTDNVSAIVVFFDQ